jgi:hypothetical protein
LNKLTIMQGVFSSHLVDVKSNHFVVSSEFWKFIVVMIPMVAVTFVVVAGLQGVWTRKDYRELDEIMKTRMAGISQPSP